MPSVFKTENFRVGIYSKYHFVIWELPNEMFDFMQGNVEILQRSFDRGQMGADQHTI